ncbi:MAG TPA: hypothetical protein VEC37_07055 [Bacillota bacterium]|nr:hypothetical protein [Bacillota bacterium]
MFTNKKTFGIYILLFSFILLMTLVGCSSPGNNSNDGGTGTVSPPPTHAPSPSVRPSPSVSPSPSSPNNDSPSVDYSKTGPYSTTTKTFTDFTVYCPRTLNTNGVKHPVITWGNGTGATPSSYSGLLRHLASYGFVVVCSNSTMTGSGTEMKNGIDLMTTENTSSSSFFYNKLNLNAIGACGHSQGGGGTIAAAKDARIKCSSPIQPMQTSPVGVQGPMLIITGSADGIISSSSVQSLVFNRCTRTAVFAELQGADHMAPTGISPSPAILKYVTAWFQYYLFNKTSLRTMFLGTNSTISQDANWRVLTKE